MTKELQEKLRADQEEYARAEAEALNSYNQMVEAMSVEQYSVILTLREWWRVHYRDAGTKRLLKILLGL